MSRGAGPARVRAPLALAGLALAVLAAPGPAFGKAKAVPLDQLPPWVRAAVAAEIPTTSEDIVWLHEERIVEPLAAGGVRVTERLAGKALKPSAFEQLGYWTLHYRAGDEIESLNAWTILPDGTAHAANAKSKDDVTDAPVVAGFELFNDSRGRTISAPPLMVGGVAAFEGVLVEKIDLGADHYLFGDAEHATLFSRFAIKVPPGWRREATAQRALALTKEESIAELAWTGRDLAPLPREELRPPASQLLPLVWVRWWSPDGARGFRDWDSVGRWEEELNVAALKDAGEAAALGARLKPASSQVLLQSIAEAFRFAARDVRYVAIEIGLGGWRPHSPAWVSANRFGDCKDKATLLRALAESWGLRAYPVDVRTRGLGPTIADVPTPAQFNHMIAAIALPDGVGQDLWATAEVEGIGRVLFLDATASENNAWDLPDTDQGTVGLLVHSGGAKLVRLPVQPATAGSIERVLSAKVDEQGILSDALLVETWTGSEAAAIRRSYASMTADEVQRAVARVLQGRFPGASVASSRLEGLDRVDAPVVRTTKISGGRVGKRVQDLLVLEPGHSGYGVVDVDLPPPPRKWPLDLERAREETIEVRLELPAGWTPEEKAPPLNVNSKDFSAHAEWSLDQGRLTYRRTARLLTPEIPAERYEEFRNAVRKVWGADGRPIVLVRPSR